MAVLLKNFSAAQKWSVTQVVLPCWNSLAHSQARKAAKSQGNVGSTADGLFCIALHECRKYRVWVLIVPAD